MNGTDIAQLKQQAAERAVEFVESGMVVGLGHGSTAAFAVRRIAQLLRDGQLQDILGVPCSRQVEGEAQRVGVPLTTLDEHPVVDLTIDGADEVDPHLNLIKGGSGALLREKIVAQASRCEIIVVDESKLSPALGTHWPVPVEVVPFGWRLQAAYLESLGAQPVLRRNSDGIPFKTDQGNLILDCQFGPIQDPAQLATRLSERAGIVEHGLFLGLATDVIVASDQGIRHLKSNALSPALSKVEGSKGCRREENAMIVIEASILAADFARLGEQAREAEAAGVDAIQVDVMDGRFVPDITFGPGVVRALRPLVSVPLDVHLMIVEPEKHLEAFAGAGADRLIVHQEACPHLHRVLQCIREFEIEAGVSINPGTSLSVLEKVLDLTDLIQIMTVNPGWGGQPFLHSQLDKIRRLRRMLDERGLDVPIAVDGGIDTTTAPLVASAGATVLIAGTSIYNDKASVAENVTALRASIG